MYKWWDTLGYTEKLLIDVSQGRWMVFVTPAAVELKENEMLLFFCCSSPQPWGTVREQESLGWEGEVGRKLEEMPAPRVGEAGDRRAAEVGIKIPCDKWPQCLCRASCLHLQAATQALPWSLGTTDA